MRSCSVIFPFSGWNNSPLSSQDCLYVSSPSLSSWLQSTQGEKAKVRHDRRRIRHRARPTEGRSLSSYRSLVTTANHPFGVPRVLGGATTIPVRQHGISLHTYLDLVCLFLPSCTNDCCKQLKDQHLIPVLCAHFESSHAVTPCSTPKPSVPITTRSRDPRVMASSMRLSSTLTQTIQPHSTVLTP